MNNKEVTRKLSITTFIYGLFILAAFLILAFAAYSTEGIPNPFTSSDVKSFDTGWTYTIDNKTQTIPTIPFKIEDTDAYSITYTNTLPKDITATDVLIIKTFHQGIEVRLNGDELYSDSSYETRYFQITGNTVHCIPLKSVYQNAEITITLTTKANKYTGYIDTVYIGNESDIKTMLLIDDFPTIASCVLLIAIIIFILIAWFIFKNTIHGNNLFYLVLFAIQLLIYSFPETQLVQYFTNNTLVVSILSFEMLMLIPIPFLLFTYRSSNFNNLSRRLALAMVYGFFGLFFINNVLHFSGLLDLSNSIFITHLFYLVGMAILIYANITSIIHNGFDSIGIGFIILILAVFTDIFSYMILDASNDSVFFSRLGLELYMLILAIGIMRETLDLSQLGSKANAYRQLALHDPLTNMLSRTAFDMDIKKFEENPKTLNSTIVMMVDLNDLKKTNDTYGHEKGDEYIKDCVSVIDSHFSNIASIYRTGGDEFTILSTTHSVFEFEYAIRQMNNTLYKINKSRQIPLSFSYGYVKFDPSRDLDFDELLKKADKAMYKMKFELKAKRAEDNQ